MTTLQTSPNAATRIVASARRTPYRVAALAGAALAADVALDPVHRHVPLCPFHSVTGLWCPLCGGLRAADRLAHLQLGAALHDNAVFVLGLPILLAWWLDWVLRARAGRPTRVLPNHTVVWVLVLAVVFTAVRNLPFAEALRPG